MKTSKEILLISAVFFLVAAGCDYNQVQLPDQPAYEPAPAPVADQPQPQALPQRQQIQVSQKIDTERGDMLFNFYADENKTALDLLKSGHTVDTKTYSGIGDMVVGINGVKADSKHFWEFIVNGKSSNVGASAYKPVNGDKIEWKLSEIK